MLVPSQTYYNLILEVVHIDKTALRTPTKPNYTTKQKKKEKVNTKTYYKIKHKILKIKKKEKKKKKKKNKKKKKKKKKNNFARKIFGNVGFLKKFYNIC